MSAAEEVIEAVRQRSAALAAGDAQGLRRFLHPQFRWVSYTGERFDRESYIESTTGRASRPPSQELTEVDVVAHDSTVVLRCQVVDEVDRGSGPEEIGMAMTQVWVRHENAWACLVGHVGPVLASAY